MGRKGREVEKERKRGKQRKVCKKIGRKGRQKRKV